MRLTRVTLENFLSWHGRVTWDVPEGLTVIYGQNQDDDRSNGAGKSALIYATLWGMWGNLPRPFRKEDLIHHGADGCKVVVTLTNEKGVPLRISRSKPRGKSESLMFRWGKAGDPVQGDLNETQQELEKIYGMSWELFLQVCYLGPESELVDFLQMKPTARAQMLSRLVDLGPFANAAKRASAEITQATQLANEHLAAIQTYEGLRQRAITEVMESHKAIAEEQQRIKKAQTDSLPAMEEMEREVLGLQQSLRQRPTGEESKLRGLVGQLRTQRTTLEQQTAQLSFQIQARTLQAGELCRTCHQIVSLAHVAQLDQERDKARAELRATNMELENIRVKEQQATLEFQTLLDWPRHCREVETKIELLRTRMMAVRDKLQSQTLLVLQAKVKQDTKRVEELQGNVAERQTKVAGLHTFIPVLRTLQAGFDREIRNMLLDEVREVLAHHTAHYLQYLNGEDFQLQYPQQTDTGREAFNIEVWRGGQPNPLTSSGETYRISLPLTFGLRDTLIHQNACRFKFLLIDDPIRELDDEGCMALADLLRGMVLDVPTIIVTAPREIGMSSDQDIWVAKRGGRSRFGQT